ncbi:hypothetical protein ACHQM5_008487 [Ranunculus cassubicifolius]
MKSCSILPAINTQGQFVVTPHAILDRRTIRRKQLAVPQVLVQWSPEHTEDATWEDVATVNSKFPSFSA